MMATNWEAFSKALLGVVGRFLLIYGLLMAPWPGLEEAYGKLFRASGNFVFGELGAKGIVQFHPFSEAGQSKDTRVFLTNRDQINSDGKAPAKAVRTDSRYHGYMPTVFLIALILATPVSWSRRGWALLWGMILIHLYIVLKIFIFLIFYFNVYRALELFLVQPPWTGLLRTTYHLFVLRFNTSFILAIVIWLLVSFRREDWLKRVSEYSTGGRLTTNQEDYANL